MRAGAWLAVLGLAWAGCQSPSPTAKALESQALTTLGERVFAAFAARDSILFEPLTPWGLPQPELHRAMRQVDLAEARASLKQLKAIPAASRSPLTQTSIQQLKVFLAAPRKKFPKLARDLEQRTSQLRATHLNFFRAVTDANSTLNWSQARGPNVVVRAVTTNTGTPEAAVEVFFSIGQRNYKLQLNTCIKLPGLGWHVAEGLALTDLTAEAAAKKIWLEDFPAAQVLARDQKKQLFVDFTGSDWCLPCIALHRNVLSTRMFLDFAKDRFVLVSVDFPRNKIQPDNLVQVNRILARTYKVNGFPTVLILDANGTEVHRTTGYNGASAADYIKGLKTKRQPKRKGSR
jgi:thioredoxin-related protein